MEKVKEKDTIGRKELASLVGKLNFEAPFYKKGPGATRKLGAALYEPELKVHWTEECQHAAEIWEGLLQTKASKIRYIWRILHMQRDCGESIRRNL